jgi:hypothetical protein
MKISLSSFRLILVVALSLYTITIAIIFLGFPDKSKWIPKTLKKSSHLQEIRVLFDDEEEEMYEYVNKDENSVHENYVELRETTFRKVGEIYFFSAYFDNRPNIKPQIRIITLKRLNSSQNIGCAFKYQNHWIRVYANKYEMCENHGRFYGGWMYNCDVPEQFIDEDVLSTSDIQLFNSNNLDMLVPINITSKTHSYHDKWKSNLFGQITKTIGICVPPLFGEINLSMLIQFIELGKLQGITHFTFYLYQVKDSIRKILNYYQEKGEVTLIDWILPPDISSREMWYNGQILSIQDCLYRNMARTKYLGFLDLDEFIIPVEFFTLTDLINSYKNNLSNFSDISAFSFQSAFFDPKQLPDPSQQLKVLQLLKRNSKISQVRAKLLTQPQNVFELGIHHVSKPVSETKMVISVHPKVAKIHHYRACIINFDPDMTCFRDIKDETILKYSDKLIQNYKEVVKNTLHLFVPQNKLHKYSTE